jgi:hypothetical protein
MKKRLSAMTTQEFKESLSIAGSPATMIEIMHDISALIAGRINVRNLAELGNVRLVLQKIDAELKSWEKSEYDRQHPKRKS